LSICTWNVPAAIPDVLRLKTYEPFSKRNRLPLVAEDVDSTSTGSPTTLLLIWNTFRLITASVITALAPVSWNLIGIVRPALYVPPACTGASRPDHVQATPTLNCRSANRFGAPSSVTLTVSVLLCPPCAAVGVQLKAPVEGSIVAPAGTEPVKL